MRTEDLGAGVRQQSQDVDRAGGFQGAGKDRRRELPEAAQAAVVEGDHDHIAEHACGLGRLQHGLFDAGVGERQVLDLDGHAHPPASEIQHFGEGGHALATELRRLPGSGIELLDLGHGQVAHQSVAVGGAIQQVVMDDRQLMIRGQVHVTLDHVHPEVDGRPERGHGVFGELIRVAAVTAQQHPAAVQLGVEPLTG